MPVQTYQVSQTIIATGIGETPINIVGAFVLNSGAVVGDFDGIPLPAGAAINYPITGKPYERLSYDASGTTLIIKVFF
jgi:hypothetical protein